MQLSHLLVYFSLCGNSAFALPQSTSGAHFFDSKTTSSVQSDGSLKVCFDEAGLGTSGINYVLSASESAVFGCFNGGGKNPSAANKRTVNSEVQQGATFQPKHGRVQACITSTAPTPGTFACPKGQTLRLISVSYSGITITDTTKDETTTAPNASRTFLPGA